MAICSLNTANDRAGAACVHLRTDTDGTVDGNMGTFRHFHGTERSGRSLTIILHGSRLCGIHCIGAIEGNQQGIAFGDGIVTGRQGAVGCQNDLGTGFRCCGQIVVQGIVNLEPSCPVGMGENRLNSDIRSRNKAIGVRSGQNLAVGIRPAQESAAGTGGSCQSGILSCNAYIGTAAGDAAQSFVIGHSDVIQGQVLKLRLHGTIGFRNIAVGQFAGQEGLAIVPAHKILLL